MKSQVRISAGVPAILTEIFHGIPQFFQELLSNDRFLSDPLKFNDSTLYNINNDNVIK
jgi:hypothetical protein